MAKIALTLEKALARRKSHGAPGHASARLLADGEGWSVHDIVCTSGPQDRAFEERHAQYSIAVVVAGTFQYRADCRAASRRELMTPGSVLLGNSGQCFECGHEHGEGDRCISFQYDPEYFESLAVDAGVGSLPDFSVPRLPALRDLSSLTARACARLSDPDDAIAENGKRKNGHDAWEELSLQLAARAMQLAHGLAPDRETNASAIARVTRVVRMMERHPEVGLGVRGLARVAGLSPYHFLRTFERVTGLTPHQYILRARLREAAARLANDSAKVLDIAFDSGFGDVSNFNRSFRAEFGTNPREYRAQNTLH